MILGTDYVKKHHLKNGIKILIENQVKINGIIFKIKKFDIPEKASNLTILTIVSLENVNGVGTFCTLTTGKIAKRA